MKNVSRSPGNLSNVPVFPKSIHTSNLCLTNLQRLHGNAYPKVTTLRVNIDQLTGVLVSYRLSHVRC
ncbi:hypothetical protein DPMN_090179 [Dreissena polymorpha]|uniref:Uncharacterized protein n=1 Tax=Dreissena polymorpha TaxID=45954 RepID=A0A9D4QZK1_DREPO|nr:hypothetical protein DPMN_090179 [Dreissena polymorpha]